MDKRGFALPVITVFVQASAVAHAETNVVVVPRVEVVQIEFSGGYSGDIGGIRFDQGYNISMQALRAGVSVALGSFYFDGYYQASNKGSDRLLIGPTNYKYESDRNEGVLALGYRLTEEAALFAGWRSSEADARASQGSAIDIDTDAYFFGGSVNFPVLEKSAVSFNAAYIYINSVDYKAKNRDIPATFKLDGDGNGWKVGVSWAGVLTDKLRYTIGADYYSYDWDADNSSGDNIQGDEDELFLRLGLSYAF